MNAPYLKANLVAELAESVGISKRKTDILLNQLAEIAYREAPNGFTVPGICRLDVVHRKPRRARLPHTGESILIGAHDTLRARLLRKAKNAVTPMPPGLVQMLPEDEPAATPSAEAPAAATPPTPAAPAVNPNNPEGLISFRCASCGQEIEAPNDMAGTQAECPTCGNAIEVPYISEPGTIWGRTVAAPAAATAPAPATDSGSAQPPPAEPMFVEPSPAMKSRTIRIELPDDL